MIPDALLDPRFADNPLVTGEPHVRFYAGKPLKGPTGRRLGTLCVFDVRPRSLNETQLAALRDLAAVVEEEIDSAALTQALAKEREREADLVKLTTIVESSHDAIISETLDGTIISWNEGAHKLYGYTVEEIKGRPMSVLVPPSRPDEATRLRQKVWHGQLVDNFETVRVAKSGKEVHVSLTISPIRNQRGEVVEASTIARDITRTKQVGGVAGQRGAVSPAG
jgi:PAS domain S-box-containing protein